MNIPNTIFQIPIVNNVIVYDMIDSTNTQAKKFGNAGCVHGTLVISDMQSAGKGRLGRTFQSPAGDGIYMSLLIKPDINPELISQLTLLSAIAIKQALFDVCNISTQIKWPNDIVYNGKKLVGILTESYAGPIEQPKTLGLSDMPYAIASSNALIKYVIIGIGINVNNSTFPNELEKKATSIFLETNKKYELEKIVIKTLEYFSELYDSFMNTYDLSFIQDTYNNSLSCLNKYIYVIPTEQAIKHNSPDECDLSTLPLYKCLGIDSSGKLICTDKNNNIITFNSGEVSVRGLDKYI